MFKIKKIILILVMLVFFINPVNADEYPEITKDAEIRYKWYKEFVVGGDYYPLKDIKKGDIIDKNNYKYVGPANIYTKENCFLPTEYYLINERLSINYNMPHPASYVLIENIKSANNVKIYYDNKLLKFNIISHEKDTLKINLINERYCDKLIFFVDTENEYTIRLYRDMNFTVPIMSKTINDSKSSKPDGTWKIEEPSPLYLSTEKRLESSELTKYLSEYTRCSYQEKYVYKYETIREYYDDQYHLNIEGYIKDEKDYQIYYKGEPITNTIEITQEKIIEVPKIEYVYIENKSNDSSQSTECKKEKVTETVTKINTQFINKEVFKIPFQIYLIITSLIIIVILLLTRLYKKYVD